MDLILPAARAAVDAQHPLFPDSPIFQRRAGAGVLPQAQLGLAVKVALHKDQRLLFGAAGGIGGQGALACGVDGFHGVAEVEGGIVVGGPAAGIAPLFGDFRQAGRVNAAAVFKGQLRHHLAVGHKAELQLAEVRGQALPLQKLGIVYGLGLILITDAVHRAQAGVAVDIVGDLPGAHVGPAGNGAAAGGNIAHRDQGGAIGDLGAVAGHAAYKLLAVQFAHGVAASHQGDGVADDAAHIAPLGAANGAVVLAVFHQAHLALAGNAAHIVLLGGDGGVVFVSAGDAFALVGAADHILGGENAHQLVFHVELILDAHVAGNAAHIGVTFHGAPVHAVLHPAIGAAGRLLPGYIIVHIHQVLAAEGVGHHNQNLGKLVGHRVHIPAQRVGGRAQNGVEIIHIRGHLIQIVLHGIALQIVFDLVRAWEFGGARVCCGTRIRRSARVCCGVRLSAAQQNNTALGFLTSQQDNAAGLFPAGHRLRHRFRLRL